MFLLVRPCAELNDSAMQTLGQGHWINPWISYLLHIISTLCKIFIKNHSNVSLSEMVCRTHESAAQTQGQGHSSRSWDLPLNFVVALYLLNPFNVFFKLQPNGPLSETMSRTHNSAKQTQGQGHTSRSWDLPLNFVSASCHLNPFNDFQ